MCNKGMNREGETFGAAAVKRDKLSQVARHFIIKVSTTKKIIYTYEYT